MPSTGSAQVAYALGVVSRLWPEPATVLATTRRSAAGGERVAAEWLLLPNPSRPTLLVPVGLPQASRMLQRHGDKIVPRAVRASMAWGVRTGQLAHLPVARIRVLAPQPSPAPGQRSAQGSAQGYLNEAVPGVQALGLILGTPRPNRKPVLQLFTADGATLGFVKVGVDGFTKRLVQTEAANLTVVHEAGLKTIEAPQVLHCGVFDDLELLALSPMHSSQERRDTSIPFPAMAELSRIKGVTSEPLASSAFVRSLTLAVDDLGAFPGASDLGLLLTRVLDRWGDGDVEFGSWHGDWAPWNMGHGNGRVQLWDWERFSCDIPLGFDAIHFRAQRVRHGQGDTAQSERRLVTDVPTLLTRAGAGDAALEPVRHLCLYLLEISSRFLRMSSTASEQTVPPRARWALDFAARLLQ
ncbi:MAG: hypothetical protein WAN48_09805 [Actinomycetes bacterium]